MESGDYAAAYAIAQEGTEDKGVDGPFWQNEAGALALLTGQTPQAVAHLEAADNGYNDVARRLYGASAADTAKAVLYNDTAMPYAPESPDRVFIQLYKAFAYGALGKTSAMRVELNRARQRQNDWFYRCSKEIAAQADDADKARAQAAENAARTALKDRPAPKTLDADTMRAVANSTAAAKTFASLRGFGNAYAAHVAGVFRWCMGDNSLNDLTMAAALAPDNAYAQADAVSERQGAKPENRVWLYVEDGLAPRRVPNPITIPYPSLAGHGQGIGTLSFNLPKLVPRNPAAAGYSVNGTALQELADVDALAQDAFDRAYPGMLARQIARTMSRVAAQEGGHAALRHSDGGALIALLFDVGMIVYDVATNEADLRCADLLPKRVWMAALPRPADGMLRLAPTGGQASIAILLPAQGNTLVRVRRPTATGPYSVHIVPLNAN